MQPQEKAKAKLENISGSFTGQLRGTKSLHRQKRKERNSINLYFAAQVMGFRAPCSITGTDRFMEREGSPSHSSSTT